MSFPVSIKLCFPLWNADTFWGARDDGLGLGGAGVTWGAVPTSMELALRTLTCGMASGVPSSALQAAPTSGT